MNSSKRRSTRLPEAQVKVLNKLGNWMRMTKESLHGAECRIPCRAGSLRFTQKGRCLYAIDLDEPKAPKVIPGVMPAVGSAIRMLGSDKKLAWRQDGASVVIHELPDPLPCAYAWVFKVRLGGASQPDPPVDGQAK